MMYNPSFTLKVILVAPRKNLESPLRLSKLDLSINRRLQILVAEMVAFMIDKLCMMFFSE